ncbi:MAG TPA: CHAT domain-containing protein [Archangium sp.]|jgi:hypothetical protein|uniref:CHAT domain-containing protein n=1 Tax=Archangium sp. TaxID=1872627 RepID=UPI002ED9AD36
MAIRTVTLELLRHGPAHNQLLSPLTPYLALCGNHDAETVHVGFEHLQFMRRIRELRYVHGTQVAAEARQEAAREVGRVLGSIRSLIAELSSSDPKEGKRMVHLRLVLSASELAMLPFELVESPLGLPGQEQPLVLQTSTPVCLTREVRRVALKTLRWPDRPRILVVAAAPDAVSAVPLREHVDALRSAFAPYLASRDEFSQHVKVLQAATLTDVREACATGAFTHVHILAHGFEILPENGGGPKYGLAFHSEKRRTQVAVVSGPELAAALRCHGRGGAELTLRRPVVVSLASCDAANVGSVVMPGASIAHALHEAGIPLVVGSQFPLTIEGSRVMTEVLYTRLLRGEDPRVISHDLRQSLYVQCPEGHDWASVVMYAALPADLESQLREGRFMRARIALEAKLARAEKLQAPDTTLPPAAPPSTEEQAENPETSPRERVVRALRRSMHRFEKVAPKKGGSTEQVKAWGILASAWKQVAHFQERGEEFERALGKARDYYFKCYQSGVREAWPLVQYLALTVGLEQRRQETFPRHRKLAEAIAQDNLEWGSPQQRVWAHASLAELALLELWEDNAKTEELTRKAHQHLREFFSLTRRNLYAPKEALFDERSTLREMKRYATWSWGNEAMRALSKELSALMEKEYGVQTSWLRTGRRRG